LHPPLLDEVGLPSALQWYVEEFSQRSGTKVTLDCSASFGRFSSAVETAIFRIVQECLGNIHRHSHSLTASIRLDVYDDKAKLVIRDQGRGIPPEKQQKLKSGVRTGVGLRGMRERVAQLGGEFQVESDSNGTTVRASLPCTMRDASAGEEVA
jgi:signal transduction histidine kinase